MADFLSPVKEECVKHGHELDVSHCHTSEECNMGWMDVSMSLVWWGTGPVRFGARKAAEIIPAAGCLIQTTEPAVSALQDKYPALSDDNSGKTLEYLKETLFRNVRHGVRSAVRSNPGRSLLQGLDKVISASEAVLDIIEEPNDSEVISVTKDEQKDKMKEQKESAEASDSAIGTDDASTECEKSTMTTSKTITSSWTNTKSKTWIGLLRCWMAKPVRFWITGLKRARRFLYRVGRLRRCKSTRTPAKEIAKRPKISPVKHQVGSFSSMIKYALSPIAGKPSKASLEEARDLKPKGLRLPLKRKHNQVTPYSAGDDSDNDTGRIIDDYFQLQDYNSDEDSDYQWHSSDDYLTSDSEEYRSDTEDEELKNELNDVKSDVGDLLDGVGSKRNAEKSTDKEGEKSPSKQNDEKSDAKSETEKSPRSISPYIEVKVAQFEKGETETTTDVTEIETAT